MKKNNGDKNDNHNSHTHTHTPLSTLWVMLRLNKRRQHQRTTRGRSQGRDIPPLTTRPEKLETQPCGSLQLLRLKPALPKVTQNKQGGSNSALQSASALNCTTVMFPLLFQPSGSLKSLHFTRKKHHLFFVFLSTALQQKSHQVVVHLLSVVLLPWLEAG